MIISKRRTSQAKRWILHCEAMQNEEVPLSIPLSLQQQLEDDCYWISRKEKLVGLPRSPTVSELLSDFYHHYCEHKPSATDVHVSLVIEILDGLKTYFDFTVSDHLLYSSEVSQYKQLTESASLSPSSIYGAEHLLRLFVRLPQFLCQAGVPAPFIQVLYHHFREFLTYLCSRKAELFSETNYIDPATHS